jgi:hypothetical protein
MHHSHLPRAAAALLLCATLSAPAWACKPLCASVAGSVVHAAGVPTDLAVLLQQLSFDGNGLASSDRAVVSQIARSLATLPAQASITLNTRGESSLAPAAALKQGQARALALQKALRQALAAPGGPGAAAPKVIVSAVP